MCCTGAPIFPLEDMSIDFGHPKIDAEKSLVKTECHEVFPVVHSEKSLKRFREFMAGMD